MKYHPADFLERHPYLKTKEIQGKQGGVAAQTAKGKKILTAFVTIDESPENLEREYALAEQRLLQTDPTAHSFQRF